MASTQTTNRVIMIEPVHFAYNPETAGTNAFQNATQANHDLQSAALMEFNTMVAALRAEGIIVTVVQDTPDPLTPDSIFPNNWFSTHDGGTLIYYPMFAPNRRLERKASVITTIQSQYSVLHELHFEDWEHEGLFLEGTGSLILDRVNKVAYACLSPRTHTLALERFGQATGYEIVEFHAVDSSGLEIYHTNVMMCVGSKFAAIVLDSIPNTQEREHIVSKLQSNGKAIITLSLEQMGHFAGNMLELQKPDGTALIVMSDQAYKSLDEHQIAQLSTFGTIIHPPLYTIEAAGGGSARCMIAENFLDVK